MERPELFEERVEGRRGLCSGRQVRVREVGPSSVLRGRTGSPSPVSSVVN